MSLDMKAENLDVNNKPRYESRLKDQYCSGTKLFWGKVRQQIEVKKHMS